MVSINNMSAVATNAVTEWSPTTSDCWGSFKLNIFSLEARLHALYENYPRQRTINATKMDYQHDRLCAIKNGLLFSAVSW